MKGRQKTLSFLTQNEIKCLLTKAKEHSHRDYTMILLAYRHGLRASEICNITLDNIDLDAQNIRCERGKGSICNWQQLSKDEVKAVKTYLKKRPKTNSKYVFISRKGDALSRIQFYRLFKTLCEKAGMSKDKCNPHILKHSIGTHLANAGTPMQVIQSRLGHRDIKNTMVYLSIANAYVDKAFEIALNNGAVA